MPTKIIVSTSKIYFFVTSYFLLFFTSAYAQQSNTLASTTLINPLKIHSIEELLTAILNIIIVLAMPVIVFFIIYAGFLYVTAGGKPEQVKQATQALTYAIIGGVLIIGAVAIATIVKNLVGSFAN